MSVVHVGPSRDDHVEDLSIAVVGRGRHDPQVAGQGGVTLQVR